MMRVNTILVAEDNEDDCIILSHAFEDAGLPFYLQFVDNGLRAMDYLDGKGPFGNREQFPLPVMVMLDLKMPVVDGFEVLKWMRHVPSLSHLPAVVFSSSDSQADKDRAQRLGADGYYTKTTDRRKLKAVLLDITKHCLQPGLMGTLDSTVSQRQWSHGGPGWTFRSLD
jgi:CheY-like chemotaxis protein